MSQRAAVEKILKLGHEQGNRRDDGCLMTWFWRFEKINKINYLHMIKVALDQYLMVTGRQRHWTNA